MPTYVYTKLCEYALARTTLSTYLASCREAHGEVRAYVSFPGGIIYLVFMSQKTMVYDI